MCPAVTARVRISIVFMPGAFGCTLNRRGPAELHGKSCTMLSPRPVPVPASFVVKNGSNACSKTSGVGPRDDDKAKKLVAEAGYKGEPVVLLDPADIRQLHAEAAVTADLLQKRLGQRAFEVVPFIPLGQYRARAAFRSYLTGVVDAPIAFLVEHREEEIASPTRP
jgi:hypothetical protein